MNKIKQKITILEEASRERSYDYVEPICRQCKLDINERLSKCFEWCYDKIIDSNKAQKTRIDIFNATETTKTFCEIVQRLNSILSVQN